MDQAPEPSIRAVGAGSIALVALVGMALAGAVFAGDASGTGGILPVGGLAVIVLVAALVAVSLGRLPVPRLGRSGAALMLVLLALVAWIGATVAWSIVGDRSWDAFNKSVVYCAFLGLGVMLGGAAGRFAARLGAAHLALVVGAALAWALVTKAIPSLDSDAGPIARLNEPVDYWNALALIANVALVLGLWLGASRWHRLATRVAGGLLVYAGTLALALTLSRVGVAAGIAVVTLWFALSRERVEGALVLAGSALPAAFVAGWAYTRPALVEDGAASSDRSADGAVLGVLAVVGALVVAALVVAASRRALSDRMRKGTSRALLVGAVVIGLAFPAALIVAIADAASSGRSCAEVANDPARLGSLDLNSRWCWWNEAWDVFVLHAPEGAGAGTFEIARKRHRQDARTVSQPHSVPLQHLADGGVVALALFLAVIAAGAATCACAVRRLEGSERAAAVALVAAPTAYALHSLVDYDWDFLAVTAPTLAALGVLASAGRPDGGRRARPLLGIGSVLLALVMLASFTAPRLGERSLRASTDALIDGDPGRAGDQADRARFWNPLAVGPIVAQARIAERRGRFDDAERRYIEAVELQPQNPEPWYELGLFEFQVLRNMCAAYRFLNNAYTLDPAGTQWVEGGELDQARDAVNAGICGP